MDLKEIKEIIALMRKNDLSEFKLEREGFKIALKRGADFQPVISTAAPFALPAPAVAVPGSASDPAPAAGAAAALREITSPMVGTFYGSPSPESAACVTVGQEVTEDTVVCIIEAMKVMNEIKAEMSGIVREVLVKNGQAVEFGELMFLIEKK